jgi:hypothetical protein
VYPHDVTVDKVLSGLQYKNLMEGGVIETESRDTFIFEKKGTGRLYSPVPNEIIAKLGDSGKSFKIESTGEKLREFIWVRLAIFSSDRSLCDMSKGKADALRIRRGSRHFPTW